MAGYTHGTPKRLRAIAAIAALALLVLVAVGATSGGAATTEVGTLDLNAALQMSGAPVACPPGASSGLLCYAVEGQGLVSGLGRVSESLVVPVVPDAAGCSPPASFRVQGFGARLTVAGKGTLDLEVADSPECLTVEGIYALFRPFTVAGGTGAYATATGSGSLRRNLLPTQSGTDTWSGTLVVPGLEFDLTAPTIVGAAAKVVRVPRGAARSRVTYKVTARDAVDGAVPVACTPKSGTRFKIGRTRVRCLATDASGNTATAQFVVTVRRGR